MGVGFVKITNVGRMKGRMIEKIYVWTELSSLLFYYIHISLTQCKTGGPRSVKSVSGNINDSGIIKTTEV